MTIDQRLCVKTTPRTTNSANYNHGDGEAVGRLWFD